MVTALHPLTNQDIAFLNEDPEDSEEEALYRTTRASTRKRKRQEEQLGEGHRTPGWIWKMPRWSIDQATDVQDQDSFNASVRIEWAKTKARAERWEEEVLLLKEEMRWALVDMEWHAEQWMKRINQRPNVSSDLFLGLTAYAYKQADFQITLAASYAKSCIPILKRLQCDFSFTSKYDKIGFQVSKGKQKAYDSHEIYMEPESEWETEDEHLY